MPKRCRAFNFGTMNQEIATGTFYILVIVTLVLQIIMWYRRNKFLRTVKGQRGQIINFKGPRIEELGTMLQTVFPVKLDNVQDGQLQELRKSAVKASNYWMVSLFLTLILPIILSNLTK
jgi:hypothetical protein